MAFDWDEWNQEWFRRHCPAALKEEVAKPAEVEPVQEKPVSRSRRTKAK